MLEAIPADRKYTKDHEWIRKNGENYLIGITDYAQRELGDVVFVDLPKVGAVVEQGKPFANVESVKAVSDIYAPVSGTVSAVNPEVASSPALLNTAPLAEGWLIEIIPAAPNEIQKLMDADSYSSFLSQGSS